MLHVHISPNFLYVLPVAVDWSSCDGNTIMFCTSGFVDDVMFSYNAGNRPESKTTRIFCPVRQVVTTGKVCHLRLHLVLVAAAAVQPNIDVVGVLAVAYPPGDLSHRFQAEGTVMQKSPTFLTHNNAIAGFTSQSLFLLAYACKTYSSTAIKLAPRMLQNLPFCAQNREKNFWRGGIATSQDPSFGGEGTPLLTPTPSAPSALCFSRSP